MNENIKLYISNLQAKPRYPKYENYHWADYLELLCLANPSEELSVADVIDRLSERERDLFEGDPSDVEELTSMEDESLDESTRRSEINDRWTQRVNDWFMLLRQRSSLYQGFYPFEISSSNELVRKYKESNQIQTLYIYLLLCSNLYLFNKRDQNTLAYGFEVLAAEALSRLLPGNAEIHLFGSNPLNNQGKYSSSRTLWDRINQLALDLNELINSRLEKSSYPDTNKGDDGLDIVGWVPTNDNLPSKLVYFGQCACTHEWIRKQGDSDFDAWKNRINLTTQTNNLIFIPFCYRTVGGAWFKIGEIRNSFLIDRFRLIKYLENSNSHLVNKATHALVKQITTARESIF